MNVIRQLSSSAVFPAAVVRPAGLPRSRVAPTRRAPNWPGAKFPLVSGLFQSRAARGLAASSLMELPGRALLVPALFAGMVTAAQAGGIDEVALAPDPCPAVAPVNDGSMTDEMFRQWLAVRQMSCPDLVPVFIDRATGLPLSPEDVLARVFNGSRIASPPLGGPSELEVVPLPGSAFALIAGLAGFAAVRRARA